MYPAAQHRRHPQTGENGREAVASLVHQLPIRTNPRCSTQSLTCELRHPHKSTHMSISGSPAAPSFGLWKGGWSVLPRAEAPAEHNTNQLYSRDTTFTWVRAAIGHRSRPCTTVGVQASEIHVCALLETFLIDFKCRFYMCLVGCSARAWSIIVGEDADRCRAGCANQAVGVHSIYPEDQPVPASPVWFAGWEPE